MMRILLDTHILLWALSDSQRLSKPVRGMLESRENQIFFSAVSIWEIAIKAQVLRIEFGVAPEDIARAARETSFVELPVSAKHAAGVAQLPMHHRDPFDRLLISQAIAEPARLLTVDKTLVAYSEDLVQLVR